MGNILNFNVNKIDMRLSNYDYWDLYLAKGDYSVIPQDTILSGDCLVAHYDFNEDIYSTGSTSAFTINSLTTWVDATNDGYILPTIGLTGIDNGLITFEKLSGDTGNTALLSALTASTLVIPSGDTTLVMNAVTGMTGNYIYPIDIISNTGATGDYARLCGGFYQGYYKLDGYSYQVLPNRVPKSWTAEVWVRPSNGLQYDNVYSEEYGTYSSCTGHTGTTLNDDYSGNTGFFLYFGTRAENKFWNIFEGLNTGSTSGCTSGATEWCTIPKETDVSIVNMSGYTVPLSPPPINFTEVTNQFLIYSRAGAGRCGSCGQTHEAGKTICTFTGDSITVTSTTQTITNDTNPFLIYSRATAGGACGRCGGTHEAGETICSFTGFTSDLEELDKDSDLVDNALGFRITEDGSIGYRKLVMSATCVDEVTVTSCTIEESYSISGMVQNDVWNMISIRFVANETLDDCELTWRAARRGKLMIYVNRRLIFVDDDFDEFIARRLMEDSDKQLAVPYNISIGGGTQGLIESMTFDGQDPDDLGSCLQDNFAGTFIGDISQFRFYICDMNYCNISNNFEKEKERYDLS